MTKDPYERKNICKASLRFLNGIIKSREFKYIKTDINDEKKLLSLLEKIKDKLKDRIFSVDCSKIESKTIGNLLNKIYDDLKEDKIILNDLKTNYNMYMNKDIKVQGNEIQDPLQIKKACNLILKKNLKKKESKHIKS